MAAILQSVLTSAVAAGTYSINASLPAGINNGDLLVLVSLASSAANVPDGWIEHRTNTNYVIFYKWALNEPSSINLTRPSDGGAGVWAVSALRLTNVPVVTYSPIGNAIANAATSGTSATIPSIRNPAFPGDGGDALLLEACFSVNTSATLNPTTSGVTKHSQETVPGVGTVAWGKSAPMGAASGNHTWTISPSAAHAELAFSVITGPPTYPGKYIITYLSSNTFTAPPGVTSAFVECLAGGGRGGNGSALTGGGGGGGGAAANRTVSLTPGNTYTVTVGAGGVTGSTAGKNSVFGSNLVVAAGGGAGGNGSVLSGGSAGAGGTVNNSTGDQRQAGSNGTAGTLVAGGNSGNGAGSLVPPAPTTGNGGDGGALLSGQGGSGTNGFVRITFNYATDSVGTNDVFIRTVSWVRQFNETLASNDIILKDVLKPVSDTTTAIDSIAKEVFIPKIDSIISTDNIIKQIEKPYVESSEAVDLLYKQLKLPQEDSASATDDIMKFVFKKPVLESVGVLDTFTPRVFINRTETLVASDSIKRAIGLLKDSPATATDFISQMVAKHPVGMVEATDLISKYIKLNRVESVTVADAYMVVLIAYRYFFSDAEAIDFISKTTSMKKSDVASISDGIMKIVFKKPTLDLVAASDDFSRIVDYRRFPEDLAETYDFLFKSMRIRFEDNISGSTSVVPSGRKRIFLISD